MSRTKKRDGRACCSFGQRSNASYHHSLFGSDLILVVLVAASTVNPSGEVYILEDYSPQKANRNVPTATSALDISNRLETLCASF